MDSDIILSHLGQLADSEAVARLLQALNTVATPAFDEDEPDQHYDWILVRRKGVELGFVDKAYFAGMPRGLWRQQGLMLCQVTFYGATRDQVSPYGHELPFKLSLGDSRPAVRAKLAALESTRHSYLTDRWNVGESRLVVAYRPDDLGLDSVHVKLPIAPLDERLRRQPEVGALAWLDLFGHAADSQRLRAALQPLDIEARIEDGEDAREVEFLEECGLTLYFEEARRLRIAGRAGRGRSLLLGAVKFHRARDLDARQYTGALPFGLSFDDSPECLAGKVGAPPARVRDGKMTGHMLWHLDTCSLHVLYSTIENHLFRVTLMAPGYWQAMAAMA